MFTYKLTHGVTNRLQTQLSGTRRALTGALNLTVSAAEDRIYENTTESKIVINNNSNKTSQAKKPLKHFLLVQHVFMEN